MFWSFENLLTKTLIRKIQKMFSVKTLNFGKELFRQKCESISFVGTNLNKLLLLASLPTFLPNFQRNSNLIRCIPTPFHAYPLWFPTFRTFPLGFLHSHPHSCHSDLHFQLDFLHPPHSHHDSPYSTPIPCVSFIPNPIPPTFHSFRSLIPHSGIYG